MWSINADSASVTVSVSASTNSWACARCGRNLVDTSSGSIYYLDGMWLCPLCWYELQKPRRVCPHCGKEI